ncbi:uncharacterized protein BJX67DRAFT_380819 [Aspergillus lucknowensis]|uniref:Nonselective cation channel n=1 Tax=Aspergillus lucknowensis TaxID=176173 RepID=A0ABR4LSG9_9EURO
MANDGESLTEGVSLMQNRDEAAAEVGRRLSSDYHFHNDPYAGLPVFATIHWIRQHIMKLISKSYDPYTIEQLQELRINTVIVRPLVDRLYNSDNLSVIYCLLVNRMHFLRQQTSQSHLQTVSTARATLCELVACRVLWRFDDENPGAEGIVLLTNILVAGFEPFQNAPKEVLSRLPGTMRWPVQRRGGYESKLTALELAIISDSKVLLSSSSCRKVIDAVYCGNITYTPLSSVDILPDHYKHRPVSVYNPRKASRLNHYRLIVPRLRSMIEVCQFIVLLVLYVLAMVYREGLELTAVEMIFCAYTCGWILEEFAAIIEHGWHVHMQNLWSFLDLIFIFIFFAYLTLRTYSQVTAQAELAKGALNILSISAPILVPRLAFNLIPDNLLFISLRAMMRDFTIYSLLAVWCFAGFFISMKWLLKIENPDADPGAATISKWMLWIWFGLDGTGIEQSVDFHTVLGPTLMITFSFLGNILFLTILVAMLTNTFSKIAVNADEEIQFRRAVLTFEGVKSDAIFAYWPPINILALVLLLPLKFVLSPRQFHTVNVAATRVLNAPLLLLISTYERYQMSSPAQPHRRSRWSALCGWTFTGLFPHEAIHAVFDWDSPQELFQDDAADEVSRERGGRESHIGAD